MQFKILSLCLLIIAVAFSQEDDVVPENSLSFLETEADDMGIADAQKKVNDLTKACEANDKDLSAKEKASKETKAAAEQAAKTLKDANCDGKRTALKAANEQLEKAQMAAADANSKLGREKASLAGAEAELAIANKNCKAAKAALDKAGQGLSAAEESLKKMNCNKDTGGTCRFLNCYAWRGAQCVSPYCMCGLNQCAENGKCVPDSAKAAAKKKVVDLAIELSSAQEKSNSLCGKEALELVEELATPAEAEKKVKKYKAAVTSAQAAVKAANSESEKAAAAQKKAKDVLEKTNCGKLEKDKKTADDKAVSAATALAEAKIEAETSKGNLAAAKSDLAALKKDCAAAKKADDEAKTELNKAQASFDKMECGRDTGGTCRILNCYSWRSAQCVYPKCMCVGDRMCAKNGKCVRFTEKDNAEKKVNELKEKVDSAEGKTKKACA